MHLRAKAIPCRRMRAKGDLYHLYLSVANYFTKKSKHCILLSYEEAERIFSQPFNLVTIDVNETTDGIMLVRYPEF